LIGRKRDPKSWFRVHNRTPEGAEEKVEKDQVRGKEKEVEKRLFGN